MGIWYNSPMIYKLFKGRKSKVSVYQKWIVQRRQNRKEETEYGDGQWEYEFLLSGEQIKFVSTMELNAAVDAYYANCKDSVEQMEKFFQSHRAIFAEQPFFANLLQKIEFQEDRLVGLSILLMRDSREIEAVKFGMLLTKYYNLTAVPRALDMLIELCYHPAFVYYGLDVLTTIDYGIIDDIYKESFGYGKQIIEEKIWK